MVFVKVFISKSTTKIYAKNTAHYRFLFFFFFFAHYRFQFLSILLKHLYESTTPFKKAIVKDFVLQHNLYIFIQNYKSSVPLSRNLCLLTGSFKFEFLFSDSGCFHRAGVGFKSLFGACINQSDLIELCFCQNPNLMFDLACRC